MRSCRPAPTRPHPMPSPMPRPRTDTRARGGTDGPTNSAVAAAPGWHCQEQRRRHDYEHGVAGVVVGDGGGRRPEAALGAGGARPRIRGHRAPARRARCPPRAQLAPRRSQHSNHTPCERGAYIPWATIAALMIFTCRGVLGCSRQLLLPEGFLGSGMDFPVGNISSFLFFSGHITDAVIVSMDMRRIGRGRLVSLYDVLNLLQGIRLLASRGHYTVDLAVRVDAGLLFNMLAGRYLESKGVQQPDVSSPNRRCSTYQCLALLASAP